uniref:Ig-like domain-containing protein n=1 Tax=Lates calcarifer TaxID=8187 RepID=A0A4W6CFQ0_LATCA
SLLLHIPLVFFSSGINCEDLTPVNNEEFSSEGSSVTLSYTYPTLISSDEFFWYRQYPGKRPQFLMYHSAAGQVLNSPFPGLKIKVQEKQINMTISSAAVTDSAVYYCAVKPTVTGNTITLYKNLWSKDNTILHNIH